MREVQVPGGVARFREQGKDEIPVKAQKAMGAAFVAARSNFPDHPELFTDTEGDETQEQRAERLGIDRSTMSVDQVLALMTLQEATVVGLLASWTLDKALPTLSTLDELDPPLYAALMAEVGGIATGDGLDVTDFSPTSMPNPLTVTSETLSEESPTSGSGFSPGPSEDNPESTPTDRQPSDIASTASVD